MLLPRKETHLLVEYDHLSWKVPSRPSHLRPLCTHAHAEGQGHTNRWRYSQVQRSGSLAPQSVLTAVAHTLKCVLGMFHFCCGR